MACVSLSVIYTGHDAGYQTCCERLVQALIIFTSFDNCSFTGINKWNSKAVNNDHQDFIRKAVCVLTLSTTIFVHIRYLPWKDGVRSRPLDLLRVSPTRFDLAICCVHCGCLWTENGVNHDMRKKPRWKTITGSFHSYSTITTERTSLWNPVLVICLTCKTSMLTPVWWVFIDSTHCLNRGCQHCRSFWQSNCPLTSGAMKIFLLNGKLSCLPNKWQSHMPVKRGLGHHDRLWCHTQTKQSSEHVVMQKGILTLDFDVDRRLSDSCFVGDHSFTFEDDTKRVIVHNNYQNCFFV